MKIRMLLEKNFIPLCFFLLVFLIYSSKHSKKFWIWWRMYPGIFKNCRHLHSSDPYPPRVCKRLQFRPPSPLKIADILCGRPHIKWMWENHIPACQNPLFVWAKSSWLHPLGLLSNWWCTLADYTKKCFIQSHIVNEGRKIIANHISNCRWFYKSAFRCFCTLADWTFFNQET